MAQTKVNGKNANITGMWTLIGGKKVKLMSEGGGVIYAILQISYPENDKVPQVTGPDGKKQTAPDTSGLWICTVKATGTYTITYGEAIPQEVEITYKGQVESVYISESIKNYEILYNFGDENEEVTGGIEVGAKRASMYSGNIYMITTLSIDTNGWDKVISINRADELKLSKQQCVTGYGEVSTSGWTTRIGNAYDVFYDIPSRIVNTFGMSLYSSSSYGDMYTNYSKESNRIHFDFTMISGSGVPEKGGFVYTLCLAKNDDISILSDYGLTIDEILTNSTLLFLDRTALEKMVRNCTGDFMFKALLNATFRSAYNGSTNKDILQASEHWSKFLTLMTI